MLPSKQQRQLSHVKMGKRPILFDSASLQQTFVTAEMRKILQVEGECKKEWLGVTGFGETGGDVTM